MYEEYYIINKLVRSEGQKRSYRGVFLIDSWFCSKRSAEAVMDVGANMVGIVKINTKGFCKDTIENLKKYWPRCSYLVLKRKSVVPRDRPLISIGCKYNTRKVLFFIST